MACSSMMAHMLLLSVTGFHTRNQADRDHNLRMKGSLMVSGMKGSLMVSGMIDRSRLRDATHRTDPACVLLLTGQIPPA